VNVGFVGTGIMGAPMAANLLRAGHDVTVWNRTHEKAEPLVALGARAAPDAPGAAAGADVVVTMLANGPAVAEVLFEGRLADVLAPGAVLVDMSSIPPATAREHAQRLAERGVGALDAPVSGGPAGAEAATLAIMVGGEEEHFERALPVLEAMGRPTRVGPAGTGQLCKLVNQVIVAVTIGAVAEGLVLAEAGGADRAAVRDAIRGGFAESRVLDYHGRRMLERDFVAGGQSWMQLKDLDTVHDVAADVGVELPLLEQIRALFRAFVDDGNGSLDHSAILLELERRNDQAST